MPSNRHTAWVDLAAWVARRDHQHRSFREAVRIVISAISASAPLRAQMTMKGGLLMAIRYDSTRFTRDVGSSTREGCSEDAVLVALSELDHLLPPVRFPYAAALAVVAILLAAWIVDWIFVFKV